jgi:acetylornithine/N-succinyldiaminopimelate aminotransferase
MTDLTTRYGASIMNTFGPPRRVLIHGEGCYVYDENGFRYLDLLGGLAVNSLGHGHRAVVETLSQQATTLMHVSNFFATPPQIALAERLLQLLDCGAGKMFFTNSGTEANEAALKVTRRTGRTRVVAAEGSFHGRTMGALSLTSNAAYRTPFAPLLQDVTFVPYGDIAALESAVDATTAAVVLEPIQGEAGVIVPPAGYLSAVRRISSHHGAMLWLDEVQTGVGRTGAWFAFQHDGVRPDLVTVAKGLGAGFPIGACIALGDAADLLGPGNHGTTFGGNPLAAAVALTVLNTVHADGLVDQAKVMGENLAGFLAELPGVVAVRGRGLLLGAVLDRPAAAVIAAAGMDAALDDQNGRIGVIVNDCQPDVVRLAPPLVLGAREYGDAEHLLPTAWEPIGKIATSLMTGDTDAASFPP